MGREAALKGEGGVFPCAPQEKPLRAWHFGPALDGDRSASPGRVLVEVLVLVELDADEL